MNGKYVRCVGKKQDEAYVHEFRNRSVADRRKYGCPECTRSVVRGRCEEAEKIPRKTTSAYSRKEKEKRERTNRACSAHSPRTNSANDGCPLFSFPRFQTRLYAGRIRDDITFPPLDATSKPLSQATVSFRFYPTISVRICTEPVFLGFLKSLRIRLNRRFVCFV